MVRRSTTGFRPRATLHVAIALAIAVASGPGCISESTPSACQASSCTQCAAMGACGWCGATGRCLAGVATGPTGTDCAGAWIWLPSSCGVVDAGIDVHVDTANPDIATDTDTASPPQDATFPPRDVAPADTSSLPDVARDSGSADAGPIGPCTGLGIGADCARHEQCCSGACIATCHCLDPTTPCRWSNTCCSGVCRDGQCNCQPLGATCIGSSGCCTGWCEFGRCVCAASGTACAGFTECCSRVCLPGGRCA